MERGSQRLLNLSLLKLNLRIRLQNQHSVENEAVLKANKDAKADSKTKTLTEKDVNCLVPGHPAISLFKNITLKINGVSVFGSENLYPHIGDFLLKTRVAPNIRSMMEVGGRGVSADYAAPTAAKDEKGNGYEVDFRSSDFPDFVSRVNWYKMDRKEGEEIDLCTYPILPITCGTAPLILPDTCSFSMEFEFNEPSKCVMMSKSGLAHVSPIVVCAGASLSVPLHIPRPSQIPRHLRTQFLDVRAVPLIINAGVTHQFGLAQHFPCLPSRISLTLRPLEDFDGNFASNLYSSQPFNLQSVEVLLGGVPYPSKTVTATFSRGNFSELYFRSMESLRLSLARTQYPIPTLAEYKTDSFIWSQDLSCGFKAISWLIIEDGLAPNSFETAI